VSIVWSAFSSQNPARDVGVSSLARDIKRTPRTDKLKRNLFRGKHIAHASYLDSVPGLLAGGLLRSNPKKGADLEIAVSIPTPSTLVNDILGTLNVWNPAEMNMEKQTARLPT